jgi:hypothetical protein
VPHGTKRTSGLPTAFAGLWRRRAAKIIQDALGTENDDITNYVFPKTWPADRVQRARIIGERLQTESAIPGLKCQTSPFFEFVLVVVVTGSLAIVLAALCGALSAGRDD